MKLKLADVDPLHVATEACDRVVAHLSRVAFALAPYVTVHQTGKSKDLAGSDLGVTVQAIVQYAQKGLPVWDWTDTGMVSDGMLSVISALYSQAGVPDLGGGDLEAADDADPDSEIGLVLLAARGRWRLDDGDPVPSRELAALSGLTYQTIRQLGTRGELPIQDGEIKAREARRWLSGRGVPGFATPTK